MKFFPNFLNAFIDFIDWRLYFKWILKPQKAIPLVSPFCENLTSHLSAKLSLTSIGNLHVYLPSLSLCCRFDLYIRCANHAVIITNSELSDKYALTQSSTACYRIGSSWQRLSQFDLSALWCSRIAFESGCQEESWDGKFVKNGKFRQQRKAQIIEHQKALNSSILTHQLSLCRIWHWSR